MRQQDVSLPLSSVKFRRVDECISTCCQVHFDVSLSVSHHDVKGMAMCFDASSNIF